MPFLWTDTISYYNWRFSVGLFDTCHIPDDWAYEAQKEENGKKRKGFKHDFADFT